MPATAHTVYTLDNPPASLCLLRLSALGDVTHMLPVVHTLQQYWPTTKLTWVIGKVERKLVGELPGVEFVVFDKGAGLSEYGRFRAEMRGRRFDLLLHMQVALRANLVAACIPAQLKIGYDDERAKDLHGLFIDRRIPETPQQHVIDGFFSFLQTAGLSERCDSWSLSETLEDRQWADEIAGGKPVVVISPCSSHSLRNWHAAGYAQVADHVVEKYGYAVAICGGNSETELAMAAEIQSQMQHASENLVGKDTFGKFIALLRRAELLVSPDAGPAHMGACAGVPVLGLYAATNPRRSGPYLSQDYCVDRFDQACQKYLGVSKSEVRWGTKIEKPGVMDLIDVESVIERLEHIFATRDNSQSRGE